MPLLAGLEFVGSLVAGILVYQGEPVSSMTIVETSLPIANQGLTAKFKPAFDWKECVVSWNLGSISEAAIRITLAPTGPGHASSSYTLADWKLSADPECHFSGKSQKDSYGELQTDTLVMNSPQESLSTRVDFMAPTDQGVEELELLSANFARATAIQPADLSDRKVWGREPLDVPQRSQMSYKNGDVLCSPTSVSMLLAYWAKILNHPELDRDVPDVAAGVFDKNWPGTGNWPFNMAYAGSLPGERAFVDRLQGVSELEKWIEAGVPVACSVSYDLLRGKGKKGANDGHLVVVVGFTKDGNPIVNDPGRSTETRQTYLRKDFCSAWQTSKRTVYLAFPKSWPIPRLKRVVFKEVQREGTRTQ